MTSTIHTTARLHASLFSKVRCTVNGIDLPRLRIHNKVITGAALCFIWALGIHSAAAQAQNESVQTTPALESQLAEEIETLKQAMINLNRDLFILEEDLLFPASTQVAVYLSMDVGEYFALDSVEVKINDDTATQYLYTERQVNALYRGGVQRLYVGNVGQGEHELTAFFIGIGPQGREYKRGLTLSFEKTDEPLAIELSVIDSTRKQQPTFSAKTL
ncbi:hypothetical protein ACFO4O_01075 [Glaciecola siphonariae]|uniref:AraC family transcriptional regulator n=1 Tax=Glaciecola siphonariae TaxID=521012 RepID=A0ABV9LQG7_9ALTE